MSPANKLIVCGTGHRPNKLGGYGRVVDDKLFDLATKHLLLLRPSEVISGMALGWDMAIAEAAYCLGIPYAAYLPFVGQEKKWNPSMQKFYNNLLAGARRIVECEEPGYASWKMMSRNRRMVDDSHKVLALWNGDAKGGTANCVQYAESHGKEVINLWEHYDL